MVLLATAGTAFGDDVKPAEQGKAKQETQAAGKAEGLPKELAVDLGGGMKMDLVLIPAGSFIMGDQKGDADEKPLHKVTITKPFYLGKHLVTQEQWQAVMGDNPSWFKGPKDPVENVAWDDCQAFLGKLNARFRRPHPNPLPAGEGEFLLPTEAQWEYACRAGSTTKWCFGDDGRQFAANTWYGDNSGGKTHPVGERRPNAWGLYDVHGNVWEWCRDWYDEDYYGQSPGDDPSGPASGSYRASRGGSWANTAADCRSAS
ncbi:MAG: formylglycine-generating enzyme family protein, partial [Thermoguttaceae bacterium]